MKPFAAFTCHFSEEDLTTLVEIARIGLQDNWEFYATEMDLSDDYLEELEGKINSFLNVMNSCN